MFLLDTNVISGLRKVGDGKADANVVAWISNVDAAGFYLSAVTLMELELGILRLERRDTCRWMRPWRYAAPACMFRTRILTAIPSLRQPLSSTA